MPDHHAHPSRRPSASVEATLEAIRQKVAGNLAIDPERLRYHDPGQPSRIGITGERWQIHYRGEWLGPALAFRWPAERYAGTGSAMAGAD